ncbi:tRNA (adenine(22)-N(1))-methyltransferase [Colwellia psychrerythraea]|uniref:tRNA (adenine(22)-N(1))-methyltransferase n=1 Tax=Colwellia psychrerythraea TaxID=28229 RepID=UPI0005A20BF6|nr:tRNA (adenine(22)-N(1))-methyltransferase TrmK [Colwellia psychrerythraea]
MKPNLKINVKISKRLQNIQQMVTSQYDHIWDCCCDHGLLGCALLSRPEATTVHFVDIVPQLMAELESKLHRFYPSSTWKTHCLDVEQLPLAQYEGKHLIIIAGIGGDLMIEFIEAIYKQHKELNIDFLLCPVHHQFPLRQTLIALDFSLKHEVLIEENRRFYEIILVSTTSDENNKIHPVGDNIWQSQSSQQSEITSKYLNKTLNHYQRIQQGFHQGKTNDVQYIIDAYHAVAR